MSGRTARIERIRVLLDARRHPERRVALFSATNLTRVAIRVFGLVAASGLVHAVLGGTFLAVPLTAIAVGAADIWTTRLWNRIGDRVRRGWDTVGIIVASVLLLALALGQIAPNSSLVRALTGGANGFIEGQQAALDRKAAARRVLVDPARTSGEAWELLVVDSALVRGTFTEAQAWCAALGPGWQLPPGLGQWPVLATYPDVGRLFYVWTGSGQGIQIGDGKRPAVGVSSGRRPTETRAVLCLRGGA